MLFCQELNIICINSISKEELKQSLTKYFAGVRTEKGEMYKINSMHSLRNGLQRHFLVHRAIDIINDDFFKESNDCFHNILKNIRASSKGLVKHFPEIEPEDLIKLYKSFNIETPVGLQEKVWLDIMFYFIRRGRENMRQITKSTFAVGCDASGKNFVYQVSGENDKNHSVDDGQFDTSGEGRMYETNSALCPYKSFVKYLNKLNPALNSFWQRPRPKFSLLDDTWYCNVAVGEKTLGSMMSTLSTKYELSQRYTNHSIRVTGLQALEDANFEGRHIIRISGHKNEESIKHYARNLSAARKRSISSVLSSIIDEEVDSDIDFSTTSALSKKPTHAPKQVTTKDNTSSSIIPKHSSPCTSPIEFNFLNADDSFFEQIPDSILQSSSASISKQQHAPVFNNCSVTINYNFYNKN